MTDKVFITISVLLAFVSLSIVVYVVYSTEQTKREQLRVIEKALQTGHAEFVPVIQNVK